MNSARLRSGPVTLYAQLGSILRDRILSGLWKAGEEIPTLEQLVEEFSVARVTVRQAVQILVEEGLLSSQRGRRTFVIFEQPDADALPLYSSTGSINTEGQNYSIQLLSHELFDGLPPHFSGPGKPLDKYVRIRKLDSYGGMAYSLSDNFVAQSVYKLFPANAERHAKLSRLVRDHARPRVANGHERIRVTTLDYEQATLLQAPIGSPAAIVSRVFLTTTEKVAYFGQFIYRGDRFGIERDISDLVGSKPLF